MVLPLWLQSVGKLLSCFTVVSIQIPAFIMVFQLICCLKRSMKGEGATSSPQSGYLTPQNKGNNGGKATRTFESWKNSVSDISTCDIITPPLGDCGMGDAGIEAKIRHRTLSWYPELKLQRRSIIRKNYMKLDRSLITKHPPHEGVQNAPTLQEIQGKKSKYKDKHITWEPDCPVYVVYGYDPCRGELEYDENTMDDLSFKEAEELEKNVDRVLLPQTPNKETGKYAEK